MQTADELTITETDLPGLLAKLQHDAENHQVLNRTVYHCIDNAQIGPEGRVLQRAVWYCTPAGGCIAIAQFGLVSQDQGHEADSRRSLNACRYSGGRLVLACRALGLQLRLQALPEGLA